MELNKENVEFLQSACNPVAVANTFAQWVKEAFHATGCKDMDTLKDNPLLLATLGKLCSLFKLEHDGERAYNQFLGIK